MPPPPKILVVDDHARFRASLHDWLEHRLPGVEVLEAATGEDAVVVAAERRPDLVLMDIGLPGMDGLETTRRIRAHCASTVVVVVSLHSTERHRAESAAAGAAAHVAKATLPQGLEGPLGGLLRQRPEPDDAVHDDLEGTEPGGGARAMGGGT